MSRAFIKEDASSEDLTIPARAPLPPDTPNYVTPRGLRLLEAERNELLGELAGLGQEGGAALALVQGKLELLEERLSSAKLVNPEDFLEGEVGIGATVTVLADGKERRLSIVGVDEANALEGQVAFTAPIAQALMGRKVGETATLEMAKGQQSLQIVGVVYDL